MKLVLLPGLDGTGDLFADFVAALRHVEPAIDCQVVAYPPDREMGYAEHEACARERLPGDDYLLLAESFSGPVGVSIAASAPPGLRGLVLCCSFASNPLPIFGPLSRLVSMFPAAKIPPRLFAPFLYAGHDTPELRRAHAHAMGKVSARALRARVAAILAVDHSQLLRRIKVPMMYLLARQDRLIPRSAFNKIDRLRPDIQLQQLDAPHFLLQTVCYPAAARVADFCRFVKTGEHAPPEEPDGPLTLTQTLRVSKLTPDEIAAIDAELIRQCSGNWRKVARIVGMSIGELSARIPDVPDVFYAQRVKHLVALGRLDSQGNLDFMRYSEVRLP